MNLELDNVKTLLSNLYEAEECLTKVIEDYENLLEHANLMNKKNEYFRTSVIRPIMNGERPDEVKRLFNEIKFNGEKLRKNQFKFYRTLRERLCPEFCYYDAILNVLLVSESKNNCIFITRGAHLLGKIEFPFAKPNGMVVYDGKLYVCDEYNHKIECFELKSNKDSNVFFPNVTWKHLYGFGSLGSTMVNFNKPYAITASNDRLYIADRFNQRIVEYDPDEKKPTKVIISSLKFPSGLAWNWRSENIIFSNSDCECIHSIDVKGKYTWSYGYGKGRAINQFCKPTSLVLNELADRLYILDECNMRIHVLELEEDTFTPKLINLLTLEESELKKGFRPSSIAFGKDERILYITDKGQGLVHICSLE